MSSTIASASRNSFASGRTRDPEQREHAERERDVGGHGHAPPVRALAAGVPRGVDERRHDHPAERGDRRQRGVSAIAELALDELALDLESDDEEEQRHEPVVDPVAEGQRPEVDAPDVRVRRRVDVRPHQRGERGGDQRECRARLDRDELGAERRQVAADSPATKVAGTCSPVPPDATTRLPTRLPGSPIAAYRRTFARALAG